jgi:D-3-phosphoglycerate dehydrogenase / 2-oxoglutarate reductase
MILLSHADEGRKLYYPDEAVAGLRALDELRLNTTGAPLLGAAFAAYAKGCSIIVGDIDAGADAEFFAAASDLTAYVHGHVDARRVDVAAASANGILVTRASPGFGPGVAELALGFMIDISRGITRSTIEWRSGAAPSTTMSSQLSASSLGILGYGHIARHLVSLVRATGMRILMTDPYVQASPEDGLEQVSLEELLATADFVVPLAVATPETKNLIDAKALARMKPTAFLINVSRGEIVDEPALKDALDRRIIAGAALDVGLAPGRLPQSWLASRPDVLATPHVGGVTPEAVKHQAIETVSQVATLLSGEIPGGAINPEAATRFRAKR